MERNHRTRSLSSIFPGNWSSCTCMRLCSYTRIVCVCTRFVKLVTTTSCIMWPNCTYMQGFPALFLAAKKKRNHRENRIHCRHLVSRLCLAVIITQRRRNKRKLHICGVPESLNRVEDKGLKQSFYVNWYFATDVLSAVGEVVREENEGNLGVYLNSVRYIFRVERTVFFFTNNNLKICIITSVASDKSGNAIYKRKNKAIEINIYYSIRNV